MARFDRKSGRFLPCGASESRASLIMPVDALGRSVMAVEAQPFASAGASGWVLCDPTSTSTHDPEEFRVWMQAHPDLKATK
jgi:hypothetical protein